MKIYPFNQNRFPLRFLGQSALTVLMVLAIARCAERPSPTDYSGRPFWPESFLPQPKPSPPKPSSSPESIPFEKVKTQSAQGHFLGQPWVFTAGSAWNFSGNSDEYLLELWDSDAGMGCSLEVAPERRVLFSAPLSPADHVLDQSQARGIAFVLADRNRPDLVRANGHVRIYGVHDEHVYGYISARVDSESWIEGFFAIPVCTLE